MQTVGVIFKTERDSFRVLDQNGQVRLVQPHQIAMRKDSNRAIATDSEGHELRIQDNVKEADGEVGLHNSLDDLLELTLINYHRAAKDKFYIFINLTSHSCSTARLPKMMVFS